MVENLVRFLVGFTAVVLVLASIYSLFIPVLRDYFPSAFSGERNYAEQSGGSAGPSITCVSDTIYVSIDGAVDLFDTSNISAKSSSGASLMSQLAEDYIKNVEDREQLFIYKINKDNTNTLVSSIDTSSEGKWVVVYLVKDDGGSASTKVTYICR